jgi:spore coat polysaccharide biosynthesis protein SpsF
MEALNHIPADLRVLACPEDSYSVFAPLAAEAGFEIHSGPKDDVLQRFCQVIRRFSVKRVIRATADNPFVFTDAAAAINAESLALGADYAGYSGLPYGAGVESIAASALLRAKEEAASPFEREHVCPYLYNHPELFSLHRPIAALRWQGRNLRITIDTQEDYKKAQALYSALSNSGEERYYGPAILSKYQELFSNSPNRDTEAQKKTGS